MNTSVCEPPSSSILLQSGLILRTPKELFVLFPFQHSKTFSKVKIWAAFVCALAGGRGYEVHNCLLSRVITHGYLGKRHQRLPKHHLWKPPGTQKALAASQKKWKLEKELKLFLLITWRGRCVWHHWVVSLLSCSASQPLFSSRASFSKSSLSSGKTRFSYHSRTIHDNPANDTNYSQTLVTSLLTSFFTLYIYLATLVNHQVTLVDQQQANRMAGNPSGSLDTSRLDISKYLTDLLTYLPTDWGRCLRCLRV